MIIVDSTVWVDYVNGKSNEETRLLESRIGREEIGLIDLIFCEVLQGLRSQREIEEVKSELLEFSIFATGGTEMAVETVFDTMKKALSEGDRIELRGFGIFNVRPRKTGIGRNPRTGAEVAIPPGKAVRFKPGKELQTLQ